MHAFVLIFFFIDFRLEISYVPLHHLSIYLMSCIQTAFTVQCALAQHEAQTVDLKVIYIKSPFEIQNSITQVILLVDRIPNEELNNFQFCHNPNEKIYIQLRESVRLTKAINSEHWWKANTGIDVDLTAYSVECGSKTVQLLT